MASAGPSQSDQAALGVIPPSNPTLSKPEAHAKSTELQVATQLLEHEMSLIYNECPHPQDLRVVSAYYGSVHFRETREMEGPDLTRYQDMIAEQLQGLRWRYRIQESFWFALEALTNEGLLNLARITSPIACGNIPADIWEIAAVLECFETVQGCMSLESDELEGSFQAPVMWFAMLVRRCSVDIYKTLDYLFTTGLFGDLDESHVESIDWTVQNHTGSITNAEVPMAYDDGKLPAMGFWLPQTFDDSSGFGQRWHQSYSQTVRVYENWFGVGSWGDWSDVELSVGRAAQLGVL